MDHKMHQVQTLQVFIGLAVAVIFSVQTTCAQAPSQAGVSLLIHFKYMALRCYCRNIYIYIYIYVAPL
jgi:hypothetical protein